MINLDRAFLCGTKIINGLSVMPVIPRHCPITAFSRAMEGIIGMKMRIIGKIGTIHEWRGVLP